MRRIGALVLAVAAVVLASTAAHADAPSQVGWWWSGHLSQVPVAAPPPGVPAGGLYVSGDPSGASGVSALRFDLASGAHDPVLTLEVASSTGTVVLGACRSAAAWTPAEGGAWDQRPAAACDRGSVAATVATEGDRTLARVPLSALVDDGVIDIVLVPGVDPVTGIGATFDVSFAPPGTDALAVVTTPAPAPASAPATDLTAPVPPLQTGSGDASTADLPSTHHPSAAEVPFQPAADVAPSPAPRVVPAASSPSDADGRIVGLVLGLLVTGAWYLTTRTAVGAQLLASTGGSTGDVRGVGRFTAPRSTPPPTL